MNRSEADRANRSAGWSRLNNGARGVPVWFAKRA